MLDYLRDPQEIYRRSFEIIRSETDLSAVPAELHDLVIRVVHASGQPAIVSDLAWSDDFAAKAKAALAGGATIFTDTRMVAEGVIVRRLPAQNKVVCRLYEAEAAELAKRLKTTRSAAAVDTWCERMAGAVVVIGNAPTALFRLIELLIEGAPPPAAILGFPIGFVGAAESKQALIEAGLGVPYVTLRGRLGGSAIAAAALNALGSEPA
ncbi:MAG: precorrin-8X methylmutase [Rhodospirillaceae bacterium]